jgi:hypothetical protein
LPILFQPGEKKLCQGAGERLRNALKALEVHTATGPVCFTVSIGVASLVQDDLTLEQIMKKADDALYAAKDQGRDRVVAAARTSTKQVSRPWPKFSIPSPAPTSPRTGSPRNKGVSKHPFSMLLKKT